MFDFKNFNIRLVILNIVIFITAFLVNDPFLFFESSYETSKKLLNIKTMSDVDQIRISGSNKTTIDFKKSEKGWKILDSLQNIEYEADASKINQSLERILECRKYYEVTDHPEKYKDFNVDDNALLLELKKGEKSYNVYIGKQGASYNTTLVRLKEEKTVYSVRGNLTSDWNQDIDYFRNKKLFSFTKDNVKFLSANGPRNFGIENPEKDEWFLIQGNSKLETNKTRVNRLLDDLANIEGVSFYRGAFTGYKYGTINIMLKSNVSNSLQVNKAGNEFIIKSEFNPYWQIIPEYRLNSLFPNLDELMPESGARK